jgi:hypothetical protein
MLLHSCLTDCGTPDSTRQQTLRHLLRLARPQRPLIGDNARCKRLPPIRHSSSAPALAVPVSASWLFWPARSASSAQWTPSRLQEQQINRQTTGDSRACNPARLPEQPCSGSSGSNKAAAARSRKTLLTVEVLCLCLELVCCLATRRLCVADCNCKSSDTCESSRQRERAADRKR